MTATNNLSRRLSAALTLILALGAVTALAPAASATIGLEEFDVTYLEANGDPATQAGSHPATNNTRLGFTIVPSPGGPNPFFEKAGVPYPNESIKDGINGLPPGFVGNPQALPKCTGDQFVAGGDTELTPTSCPINSQVGYVILQLGGAFTTGKGFDAYMPLFNLVPPPGTPALFGFSAGGTPAYLEFDLRTGEDYGLTAKTVKAPATIAILGLTYVFWGVPADPIHEGDRGYDEFGVGCANPVAVASNCAENTISTQPVPFLSLPTSCTGPGPNNSVESTLAAESWDDQGNFAHATSFSHDNTEPTPNSIGFTGCNAVAFSPTIQARPTTNVADSASGLDVDVHLPVHEGCDPGPPVSCETSEAQLKDISVNLPEGFVVNPSGANGLDGCSEANFGYTETGEDGMIHTTPDPASCPDAAKQGTVEIQTPLLDHSLKGGMYLAKPYDNPFGSLLALYLTTSDPQTGLVVKLAGKVTADPQTGQLSASFEHNPEQPFEDFVVHFFGGASGALRTPATCGNYTTNAVMTPWTFPDSGPPATPSDTWAIQTAPGGGNCPTSQGAIPNSPDLDAGSVTPVAAANTPTIVNLRRNDGTQEFSTVSLTLPPGLTGKLSGVSQCSDADLAAAASKSGHQEKSNPSCPASSRIGTVDVAAGAGPAPYNTQGTAYLTGPYKGAPLGMAIVTPATAGPFDLGTVVVRVALFIDRNSAQITAVSDPIPHILQGIPLDVRSAKVTLDRANFTRNGTSCDPSSFTGALLSTLNNSASLSERFQLGECSSLAFKPKLGIRLIGGTKRGAHPALKATLQMPEGGANIGKAVVALPHSEFLDQAHIGTVCTRVQFSAKACPAASVYGNVVVTSPLVDYALEGPAYLRSSDNKLPDLVMALHGPPSQPIEVDAVGRIDSVKGGIRTTFEGVPDLPVSTLVLNMAGAKKGLLQNSTNICKGTHKATAEFTGQNGKAADFAPVLKNSKCGKAKRKAARRAAHRRATR